MPENCLNAALRLRNWLLLSALIASGAARAQVVSLDPFTLSGTLQLGQQGRRLRPIQSWGGALSTPSTGGFTELNLQFASDGSVDFTAQLQRVAYDDNGDPSLAPWSWVSENGEPNQNINYQQSTRVWISPLPGFLSPATGDLVQDIDLSNECSLQVVATPGSDVTSTLNGLTLSAIQGPTGFQGFFSSYALDSSTSNPRDANGYVLSGASLIGELLVPQDTPLAVTGVAHFSDGNAYSFTVPGPVVVNAAACSGAVYTVAIHQPDTRLAGSLEVRPDPSDIAAGSGPRATAFAFQFSDADTGQYEQYQNINVPSGGGPATYDFPTLPGTFYLQSLLSVNLVWNNDANLWGQLTVPFDPTNPLYYSPVATPDGSPLGVWPDSRLEITGNEHDLLNLSADMAYLDGHIVMQGCPAPGPLAGSASMSTNLPQPYPPGTFIGIDEAVRQDNISNGIAQGPIFPDGSYEVAAVANDTWGDFNVVVRSYNALDNIDSPDYLWETIRAYFIDPTPYALSLTAGRANAVVVDRDLKLGHIVVAVTVRNTDGSLRPFINPHIDGSPNYSVPFDTSLGVAAASFESIKQGAPPDYFPLRSMHFVNLYAPPGKYDLSTNAYVGANNDGSGALNSSSFPTITVTVPNQSACQSICVDSATGNSFADDGLLPQLNVNPVVTSQVVSGTVVEAAGVLNLTANGQTATLAGSETDATRAFAVPLALNPGDNQVAISASNTCGRSASTTTTVRYDTAPQLGNPGAQSATAGTTLSFTVSASDPDGDVPTLSASGLPTGATFSGGVFTWTPGPSQTGTTTVVFTATEPNYTVHQSVQINVAGGSGSSCDTTAGISFGTPVDLSPAENPTLDGTYCPNVLMSVPFTWAPACAQPTIASISATYTNTSGQVLPIELSPQLASPDALGGSLDVFNPGDGAVPLAIVVTIVSTDGSQTSGLLTMAGFEPAASVPPPTIICPTQAGGQIAAFVDGCGVFHGSTNGPQVTVTCQSQAFEAQCDQPAIDSTSIGCSITDQYGHTASCTTPVTVTTADPTQPYVEFVNNNQPYQLQPDGGICSFNQLAFYFYLDPGCDRTGALVSLTYQDNNGNAQPLTFTEQEQYYNSVNSQYVGVSSSQLLNPDGSPLANLPSGSMQVTATFSFSDGTTVSQTVTSPVPEQCLCQAVQTASGQVLYEDLWPENGDLDFNDQNIGFQYALARDLNSGLYTRLEASFTAFSLGATLDNGVYLHLPNIGASRISQVVRYLSDGTSRTCVLGASAGPGDCQGQVQGEAEAVIPITRNTRELFNNQPGFINTVAGGTSVQSTSVSVVIEFSPGLQYGEIDTGTAPFDLFIARTGDYGHQVHLSQYPGTALMDSSLYGQGQDNSYRSVSGNTLGNPGVWFVNQDGLPFAIAVPDFIGWPLEKTDISSLYQPITDWAASGGQESSASGWYTQPTSSAGYNGAAAPQGVTNAGPTITPDYSGCED